MNTELPWKRFAAEALVIVVSILLALAADAWWEGRNNQARERLALNDLAVELNQNIDQIDNVWLPRHYETLKNSLIVLRSITGLPIESATYDQVFNRLQINPDWYPIIGEFYVNHVFEPSLGSEIVDYPVEAPFYVVRMALISNTYGPSLASLDLLFQSGFIGDLQDSELRSRLAALPVELNDLAEEEDLLLNIVFSNLRPELESSISDGTSLALLAKGINMTRFAPDLAAGLGMDTVTIQPSEGLARVLAERMAQNLQVILQMNVIRRQFVEILELL
jgi:uncharacterized membrane protein YidH (DUF202 family)